MYTNVTFILNKEKNVLVRSSDNFCQVQLCVCILVMILYIMCSASLKRVDKTILQIFEYTHHTLPKKKCIWFLGTLDTTILVHKLSTKALYIYCYLIYL